MIHSNIFSDKLWLLTGRLHTYVESGDLQTPVDGNSTGELITCIEDQDVVKLVGDDLIKNHGRSVEELLQSDAHITSSMKTDANMTCTMDEMDAIIDIAHSDLDDKGVATSQWISHKNPTPKVNLIDD